RNNVKARTTLLLALPDEHQLRLSKYETTQELWGAILKTFGGNESTKKTKKNQLKQQYGNFKADGSETLEQTFNRLQAIVSHLEFMDVEIEQDDLNQKFLTNLALEWVMYTIYLQNEHYALWEVIEFGDSYEAPQEESGTCSASESSAKKKGRTIAVTTEDMQKRRNDVKVRTTLLLALPVEHQLRFSKYKTAQEL
nr:hypothetical protein [Tanacetum cinerariifolium]